MNKRGKILLTIFGISLFLILLLGIGVIAYTNGDGKDYETPIGYKIYNDKAEIWNTKATYYFNKTSGIQWTQNAENFWTKNVFCIGYYSGETWNKIKCADELGEFNRDIQTDNLTYVNATLWKDFTYSGYDMRIGIRYHLKLNDEDLSVIIYGKNIDNENIPYELGFVWKVKDIKIDGEENDKIVINNSVYNLDENLDVLFKNMIQYDEITNSYYASPYYTLTEREGNKYIKVKWNENLDYAVKLYSDGEQSNSYVSFLVNAGLFSAGQEKSTTIYWRDPEGDYTGVNWSLTANNNNADDLTTDGNYIWIADLADDEVYKYYMNGTYTGTSWDTSAQSNDPEAITSDETNIWIGDYYDKKVYRYDISGNYLDSWSPTTGNDDICGIATDGNNIWIGDCVDDEVYKYNMSGNYIAKWDLNVANSVSRAITTDGNNIWATDVGTDEVYKYDMNGNYNSSWDTSAQSTSPSGLTVYGNKFWLVEYGAGPVFIYEGPAVADTTPPNVTINSPLNQTYWTSVKFNATAIDNTAMDSCWYSLNNGVDNFTMTNASNSPNDYIAINSSMAQGNHTVNFYCNDTLNNLNNTETRTFFIDSIAPETITPILNSTDGTNKSNQNLNCYATLTDNFQTNLIAYWKWYKNNVSYLSGNKSVTNGIFTLITILDSANITKGEEWICEVIPYDGYNYGTAKNSSILTILNSAPTQSNPLLSTPSGKNFSYENVTCYNQSTSDPDGDEVINIYNWYKNSQSFLAVNLPFEINANDYSGNGNDGSINGATATSNGKIGGAYEFYGNENITILDSSTFDFDNEKTWQLWFKRSGTGAETFFNKGDGTYSNYKLEFLEDNKLKFSYSLELGWQNNSEEFDLSKGTYNQTYYNTTYNAIMLNDYDGDYKSEIFNDSGKELSFNTISFSADAPMTEELSVEDGMVGLWHFNENSGTTAYDETANNNDGIVNGATWTTGKFNSALNFDGINDGVNVLDSNSLSFGNGFNDYPFTISAWIYLYNNGGVNSILLKDYTGKKEYQFYVSTGHLTAYLYNLGGTSYIGKYSIATLNSSQWYQVTMTYNGNKSSSGISLYINGQKANDGISQSSPSITAMSNTASNVSIGYSPIANWYLNGTIDEIAIWNKTLSSGEISENYNKSIDAVTNLSLSARSCTDNDCSDKGSNWDITNITSSSYDISSLSDNKYFQFKADFVTDNLNYSPKLYNLNLSYSAQVTEQEANITSNSEITDNEWHLATVTYDTNNLKLYINDALDAQKTETSSPSYEDNNLTIGQNFNGSIDEFRIYQEALTLEQISAHYNLEYNKIVPQQTSGGDNWMCQITPNDGEEDGITLNSSVAEIKWAIIFNVTSGETGEQLSNLNINCNNSFSASGVSSPYTTGFLPGNYECIFWKGTFYNKTKILTANADKTVDVVMSKIGALTSEEHTWLEAIYNCLYSGDCSLYNLLLEINQTVSNIWENTKPTDESVITFENITNKVVDSSHNLTIDYSVYIPIKAGYVTGTYLPVRIGFWFLNSANTTCYNQGTKPTGVEEPYCQPLIIETLGPMGGSVNFTVKLHPSLSTGNYSIKRIIDIDPNNVWINYGQDVIGSFVMTESLSNYGISVEKTGENNPSINNNQQASSSQESSSSSSNSKEKSVTNIYNIYNVTNIIQENKTKDNEDKNISKTSGITGGVIQDLLSRGSTPILLGVLAFIFVISIIYRTIIKIKKK